MICEEGSGNLPVVKKCRDPIPACKVFNTEPWCSTRSACKWDVNATTCKPSFNTSIYDPDARPVTVDIGPACCSENHQTCSNQRHLVTPELCLARDAKYVWLSNGSLEKTQCFSSSSNMDCTKNEECCGTLVCAPSSGDATDVKCRHPLATCPSYTSAGSIKCGVVPGCKWFNATCVPSYNATIFDDAFPQVRAAFPAPQLVRSQLDGNPDKLGLCTGFVGFMHGDPHFNSFDRRKYNCMGTGAFVLVKSKGILEIQGLFYQAGGGAASVTRGIALEYPALPTVPRIQISMAETANRTEQTTYMINNECPAHIFLDGELRKAARNNHFSDEGSYAMTLNADGGIDLQFFNTEKKPITAIRIRVSGSPKGTFGCYMDVQVCLPLSEELLRNTTVGLFGTPNGNKSDEWTTAEGKVIPLSGSASDQYGYCTSNHCVERQRDSLFIYEGKSFKELYSCKAEFPGEPNFDDAPQALKDFCKGNTDCLLEGLLAGPKAAVNNLVHEELIADVVAATKVIPEVKFLEIIPVRAKL